MTTPAPMGDPAPDAVPFPLISMFIRSPLAGSNRGRHAKVWLHPDGSVTWQLHDLVPAPRRRWWQLWGHGDTR